MSARRASHGSGARRAAARLRGRLQASRTFRLTILSLPLLLGSCLSISPGMKPEREIPVLDQLGSACDLARRKDRWLRSTAMPDGPLDIRCHEYGKEDAERVLVMIHGVASDHRAWRYVIGGLNDQLDVWAIDMPGCGESDKPNPKTSSDEAYTPTWLARHVGSALRDRLRLCDHPVKLTLVGHSLGGGVVLRMLGCPELREEYADVLEHVDGAVLMSSHNYKMGEVSELLKRMAKLGDVESTVGIGIGEVRRVAADATRRGTTTPDRMPVEEFERIYEVLLDPDRRHAMSAMLAQALPMTEDEEPDYEIIKELLPDYGNVDVPCLILWGQKDNTLQPNDGWSLQSLLPDATMREIEDCMHSLQVDDPETCTAQIEEFLAIDGEVAAEPWLLPRSNPKQPVRSGESEIMPSYTREDLATAHPHPLMASPSSVSVLVDRDIQRSGVRYFSDALRVVPGVEVMRVSSTESEVAFRGYVDSSTTSQGVLGMVDGRQVYNQFLGAVFWDQLAVRLEDVDRVQVIRGPGSFIHGPNAMHGVVDIRTRSPLDYADDSVSAIAHMGSYDSVVMGTTVVNRTNHSGFKTSAQWEDIDQFGDESTDTRDKGFFESTYAVELDGDPEQVLELAAGYSQQRFNLLLPEVEVIPSTSFLNQAQELFGRASYRSGDPEDESFELRGSWTGFNSDSLPNQYYEQFSLDLDTIDIDAKSTLAAGPNLLVAGAGYRHATSETVNDDVTGGRQSINQVWGFVQDDLDLSDDLTVTAGLRIDHHSTTGTDLSPRLAAVWEAIETHFFRASVGRGFRNPSMRELWFDMQITGVPGVPAPITIGGNEALEPESLTSFELSYSGAWGEVEGKDRDELIELDPMNPSHQFEAGVSVFYNLIDDLIVFQSDPSDPLLVRPVNQNDEEAFGFELEGRYVFSDWLSLFGNYSWSQRRDRETGERNLLAPQHKANLGMGYSGEVFQAMLWANYYDETELFGVKIDSYVLVNGSISYHFPVTLRSRGQAFVRVFNLLDDVHREHPQGDAYGLLLTAGLQFEW